MKRLKELRTSRHLSQTELARQLGFSQSIISAWELGSSEPSAGALIALSRFFDVSADYLLELVDDFGDKLTVPELSDDKRTLFDLYSTLTESDHKEALRYLRYLKDSAQNK